MLDWTLEDILALRETDDVEFKKASGIDGKGALPREFWSSYSAFANTNGGDIFLGIEELKDKTLKIVGVANPEKMKKEIFDLANNTQKISANLIENNSIEEIIIEDKTLLRVHIPRANRKLRPVHITENPLTSSYQRRHEGDYKISPEAVKRMLTEQGEDTVDARILKGFTIDDLDNDTLVAYRNVFAARASSHPFLNLPFIAFLRSIGAWRQDRDTNNEGLTLAGLLMFGKLRSILDEVPNYILDYQERPEAKAENRWIDRLTTDGSWSGNLYDFYRRTYQKLTSDLKVPFKLEGATRLDETPVHEALREGLVNSLIHADFSGRVSILIVKRPDMFGFRNPGLMRVPVESAIQGGDSDCRNRNLQKMFQFIGAGEQAGSGIPKIYQNWKQQHWKAPKVLEKLEPEQTLFELHMSSLLPQAVLEKLDKQFGERFRELPEIERQALVLAESEGGVDHKRLKEISSQHPSDISKSLNHLVKNSFLETSGTGRGTSYYLAGSTMDNHKDLLSSSIGLGGNIASSSIGLADNSIGLGGNIASSSIGLGNNSIDLEQLEIEISAHAKTSKKISTSVMQDMLLKLCDIKPQTLEHLSTLLQRSSVYLRNNIINNLIKNGELVFLYPDVPNHPSQAYIKNKSIGLKNNT